MQKMIIMGVFTLVSLVLFVTGSVSAHSPKHHNIRELDDCFYTGKQWVVLVATTSGWSNYAHQADICHAYQIIKGNGIPQENIITMMVDDIANNTRNPTPGKIINKPNGTDVYQGVVIDYKGNNVTKTNFLNIISGNGTGKVVKGGPRDTIFINIIGYGLSGSLYFPDNYLYADELNKTLNTMYKNNSYKKILMYIEGSKTGSMFDGILSESTNVLAVTAAGPRENSYKCYCGSVSKPYGTCLGDEFGVTWMENLDAKALEPSSKNRLVFNHFREVRTNVTDSNVMIYGDFNVGNEKLSKFIGYRKNNIKTINDSTSEIKISPNGFVNENDVQVKNEVANNEFTN